LELFEKILMGHSYNYWVCTTRTYWLTIIKKAIQNNKCEETNKIKINWQVNIEFLLVELITNKTAAFERQCKCLFLKCHRVIYRYITRKEKLNKDFLCWLLLYSVVKVYLIHFRLYNEFTIMLVSWYYAKNYCGKIKEWDNKMLL
jgi:hypothetical protein